MQPLVEPGAEGWHPRVGGDGIVRISVGLEAPEDLVADLDRGLRGHTLRVAVAPLAYTALKGRGCQHLFPFRPLVEKARDGRLRLRNRPVHAPFLQDGR